MEIEVDGVKLTDEDVRRMQVELLSEKARADAAIAAAESTKTNTLQDYHKKTQELATERRVVEEEKARLAREQTAVKLTNEAIQKDVKFYETHPPAEWASYQSEYDKIVQGDTGRSAPIHTAESDKRFDALMEKFTQLENSFTTMRVNDADKAAKASLIEMEGILNKSYPLGDKDAVRAQMYMFFSENRRIPTTLEVTDMVRKSHQRAEGLIMNAKKAEEVALTEKQSHMPRRGGTPASYDKKKTASLGDTDAAVENGRKFFKQRYGT